MRDGAFLSNTGLMILMAYFFVKWFFVPIPDLLGLAVILLAFVLIVVGRLKKMGLL